MITQGTNKDLLLAKGLFHWGHLYLLAGRHLLVFKDFKSCGLLGFGPSVIAFINVRCFFEGIQNDACHFFAFEEILGHAIFILAPDVGVDVIHF